MEVPLKLTLKELYTGTTKRLKITRRVYNKQTGKLEPQEVCNALLDFKTLSVREQAAIEALSPWCTVALTACYSTTSLLQHAARQDAASSLNLQLIALHCIEEED